MSYGDVRVEQKFIQIRKAAEHNLKHIDVNIPRDKLIVITGVSGSGKSSLAFDTIYAEGQRRYVESLSAYARQFLEQMQKPDVESIEGLPPTIAIEQRSSGGNPRSTVATTTEIYDYLRLLYARCGIPHCHLCGRKIARQTPQQVVDAVLAIGDGSRILILAPLVRGRKGEHKEILRKAARDGYVRVRVDGKVQLIEEVKGLNKNKKHTIEVVVDRLVVKSDIRSRLHDSIEVSLSLGEGLTIVSVSNGKKVSDHFFSELYACPECGVNLEDLAPRVFSFNSPYGACPTCDGLGRKLEIDPDFLVPDTSRALNEGAVDTAGGSPVIAFYVKDMIREFQRSFAVPDGTPVKALEKDLRDILFFGTSDALEKKYGYPFSGLIPELHRQFENTKSDSIKTRIHSYMSELPCPDCKGGRLRAEALAVLFGGRSIAEITAMTVEEAIEFLNGVNLESEQAMIAGRILKEIRQRLEFMADVGLPYLTLDRGSSTLSGGESQRIRLAAQVGSGLVGVCYVLDEPTIGLHQRDNQKLIATLRRLQSIGNTVVVVEHDEQAIRSADHILDLGPGAGAHGGDVIAQGSIDEIEAIEESVTGQYLCGNRGIRTPMKRRSVSLRRSITVSGAKENNLKSINVRFPTGGIVCVTGVSGSGKSTLVTQILHRALVRKLYRSKTKPGAHDRISGIEHIDKVIKIDQSPIGRTPRSNPATYTGVWTDIRGLFTRIKEARVRGYKPGRFSFNVKGGRCEACEGQGTKKIEMHFLPDVFVTCEVCKGQRFNRETLEIRYKGNNIADILDMTVEEALEFFQNFPRIKRTLQTIHDVGLGYIKLGQSSTTLSGGEAQRVRLSSELGRATTGRTLYILDEPTTGLHFDDVNQLLQVLNRLADGGNTIVIIEHNLDVVKCADYIIDLGPEGGDAGGRVVAKGLPEEVAQTPGSHTGRFLKDMLAGKHLGGS